MHLRLQALRERLRSRQAGQILVLFAVFVIVLMVLAGSAYDYASIVVDDARLQNAVDAAALAGADSLTQNELQAPPTQVAWAEATTQAYLSQDGVTSSNASIAITPIPYAPGALTPTPVATMYTGISVAVSRNHPTAFWPLVGINSVTLHDAGQAQANNTMMDIMLSMDTTGSLVSTGDLSDYVSGQTGYHTLENAISSFVQQIAPTASEPLGPKVGIARYAGIKCTWTDANHNGYMDYNYPGPSEYGAPCHDDETVLTALTNSASLLDQIASGPQSGCPANAAEACPIQHHPYILTSNVRTNGCAAGNMCSQMYNGNPGPYYTGTKEPNAICAVNPGDSLCTETPSSGTVGFAWSTANGGRNGSGNAQARRILVIMTDGQDEAWPTSGVVPGNADGYFPESVCCSTNPGSYDYNFIQLANHLKAANPAGANTGPGVEIYVVGYFCTNNPSTYQSGSYPPLSFCESAQAYQSPHQCPGPMPQASQLSPVDQLLINVSSSSAGTCDHYIPLSKTESLPTVFSRLAGTISRGKLTQ